MAGVNCTYHLNGKKMTYNEFRDEISSNPALIEKYKLGSSKVPNNPLLKNWQELSVKRALKEAVDNNSEYLAWINGEQTAARYNLSKSVDKIEWSPSGATADTVKRVKIYIPDKTLNVTIDKNNVITSSGQSEWLGKKIDDVIGKGIGEKIMKESEGNLSGEGLNIGGEWATTLYGNAPKSGEKLTGQVKNIVEDITGHRVETIDLGLPIDKNKPQFYDRSPIAENRGQATVVKPNDLKIGKEITKASNYGDTERQSYIITDILGDGKFKAVPKADVYDSNYVGTELIKDGTYLPIGNRYYPADASKTFDISTKKSTGQQAIKITPEIRARIRGEALKLKKPSGTLPFNTGTSKQKGRLPIEAE